MTIHEVGNVAAFLLSDLSSAITGEVMHVDNGFSILGGGMRGLVEDAPSS